MQICGALAQWSQAEGRSCFLPSSPDQGGRRANFEEGYITDYERDRTVSRIRDQDYQQTGSTGLRRLRIEAFSRPVCDFMSARRNCPRPRRWGARSSRPRVAFVRAEAKKQNVCGELLGRRRVNLMSRSETNHSHCPDKVEVNVGNDGCVGGGTANGTFTIGNCARYFGQGENNHVPPGRGRPEPRSGKRCTGFFARALLQPHVRGVLRRICTESGNRRRRDLKKRRCKASSRILSLGFSSPILFSDPQIDENRGDREHQANHVESIETGWSGILLYSRIIRPSSTKNGRALCGGAISVGAQEGRRCR